MVKDFMSEIDYFRNIFKTPYRHAPLHYTVTFINVNNEELFIDRRYHNMSELFFIVFKTEVTEQKIFRSKELMDILVEPW